MHIMVFMEINTAETSTLLWMPNDKFHDISRGPEETLGKPTIVLQSVVVSITL